MTSSIRAILTGLVLFSFQPAPVAGLSQTPPTDARMVALGGPAGALEGIGGAVMNPAALAGVSRAGLWVGFSRPFGLSELDAHSVEGVLPTGSATVSARLSGFGFDDFGTTNLGLGAGFHVSDLAVGLRVEASTLTFGGYDGRSGFSMSAGWMFALEPGVIVGGSILNLGSPTGPGPTAVVVGLSTHGLEHVLLTGSVVGCVGRTAGLRVGVEVRPVAVLAFRMGTSTHPESAAAGVGLVMHRLRVDLAFSHHPRLGGTPVLTLTLLR